MATPPFDGCLVVPGKKEKKLKKGKEKEWAGLGEVSPVKVHSWAVTPSHTAQEKMLVPSGCHGTGSKR